MARHSGDDLALQVSTTDGGPYDSMGCFTQLAVNATRDRFEVTCGGDANKTYVLGKKDFTVTGTMVWDDTNDEVWEAADSDTPLFYNIVPDLTDNPGWNWRGQFYIDVSMDIPVAGAITSGVNLAASGSITNNRA